MGTPTWQSVLDKYCLRYAAVPLVHVGLENSAMLGFRHKIHLSEGNLRRLLRIMGLYRRKQLSDILYTVIYKYNCRIY